jgi:hypothetical protein
MASIANSNRRRSHTSGRATSGRVRGSGGSSSNLHVRDGDDGHAHCGHDDCDRDVRGRVHARGHDHGRHDGRDHHDRARHTQPAKPAMRRPASQ